MGNLQGPRSCFRRLAWHSKVPTSNSILRTWFATGACFGQRVESQLAGTTAHQPKSSCPHRTPRPAATVRSNSTSVAAVPASSKCADDGEPSCGLDGDSQSGDLATRSSRLAKTVIRSVVLTHNESVRSGLARIRRQNGRQNGVEYRAIFAVEHQLVKSPFAIRILPSFNCVHFLPPFEDAVSNLAFCQRGAGARSHVG